MKRNDSSNYALSILGGGHADPALVFYGQPEQAPAMARLVIVPCGFFGDDVYGKASSLPILPLADIEGIPLLFGTSQIERRTEGSDPRLVIHADIVASAYFLLTRYEEVVRRNVRDEHGRFPGRESLPFRAGFLHRPIVDEYAALLRRWASDVGIELARPNRRFSVLLTHDVDSLGPERGLFLAGRSLAASLLGRRASRQALSDAAINLGLRQSPHDNLADVIRLDRSLTDHFPADRCRALYFFMAGGDSPYDGAYSIRCTRTRARLIEVSASGAGLGLHASYAVGTDPTRIGHERHDLQEAAGLPIEKNRHHFLNWREPEHGTAMAASGICWDSTLGYADVAGFRLGVCHPVPLFDPVRQCPMGIEEHPLLVMDGTLDRLNAMGLDEEAAFECVRTLADATFRHQGEFVCLWHNTALASTDAGYHRRLYPRVLDYLTRLLKTETTPL